MYKTRLSERHISYERFYLAMPHFMEALEIINGTHPYMALFADTYRRG